MFAFPTERGNVGAMAVLGDFMRISVPWATCLQRSPPLPPPGVRLYGHPGNPVGLPQTFPCSPGCCGVPHGQAHVQCVGSPAVRPSVLYEVAQYCLTRPWHRFAVTLEGSGLPALTRFLAAILRTVRGVETGGLLSGPVPGAVGRWWGPDGSAPSGSYKVPSLRWSSNSSVTLTAAQHYHKQNAPETGVNFFLF